jgi:hypothetical protein
MMGPMAMVRPAALGVLAIVTLLLTGCGSGGSSKHASATHSSSAASPSPGASGHTGKPAGAPANAGAVAVIRGWSTALRQGHLAAAARFFATPSVIVNGTDAAGRPLALPIRTLREAELANASLPCGAKFVSASRRGHYINALFRLTARSGPGGSNCAGGAGQTARTDFVIAHGKIVQWIRAPDEPGDNGGSGTPPTQTAPAPGQPTPTSPTPTLPTPQNPPDGGPAV